jgi:hypothetical protein
MAKANLVKFAPIESRKTMNECGNECGIISGFPHDRTIDKNNFSFLQTPHNRIIANPV